MSFTLQVKFTGICTFVPNVDKSKYYVVIPNGDKKDDKKSTGADLKDLRRHRAFVRFKIKDLLIEGKRPNVDGSVIGNWYFKKRIEEGGTVSDLGCQLSFRCHGASGSLGAVDLSHIANLEDFAPDFCTIDPKIVTGSAPESVVGLVLIDKGALATTAKFKDWTVLNTLNPGVSLKDKKLNPQLASEVVWQVEGLNSLELAMTPFGTGTQDVLGFQADADGIVEIRVVNLCDKNPLQWGPIKPSRPDLDFRWHYELLDPTTRQGLVLLLNGRDLPFPIPKPTDGIGMNCLPTRGKTSVDF